MVGHARVSVPAAIVQVFFLAVLHMRGGSGREEGGGKEEKG
jgi:hypothetical protein